MTTAMDFSWSVQADGLRLSFPVVRGNGTLRTGFVSGDFTVTVTEPGDSATSTPSVTELASKAGHYTALVPSAFLTTNGVGDYHFTIEVNSFLGSSGAPHVRLVFGGIAKITARDFDDLATQASVDVIDAIADILREALIAGEFTAAAGSSTTEIRSTAAQATGFYDDMVVVVVNSAGTAARNITAYNNINGAFTVGALPFTPAVSDPVYVLSQSASAAISTAGIADAVWDEDIVAGHGTGDSAGLLLRALGALISQRSNTPTLSGLLGIADSAGVDLPEQINTELETTQGHGAGAWTTGAGGSPSLIADAVWDEDIVLAHGTADSAGLLVRALGALISQRSNSPTLDALLGVTDAAGVDLPEQINTELETTQGHGAGAWTSATGFSTHSAADVWTVVTRELTGIGSSGIASQVSVDIVDGIVDIIREALIAGEFTAAVGSSTTEIRSTAAQADGFFDDMVVVVVNAAGTVARNVAGYLNTNGAFTVATLPFTPSISDPVYVLSQSASAAISTAGIADAVWDEDVVSAHGTASSAGLLVRALGAAISTRVNSPTLNALLGVADSAGTDLPEQINTELETVQSHGAGAWTSSVPPSVGAIADAVWDEAADDHLTAGTTGRAQAVSQYLGGIWIDTASGAAGTTVGTHGLPTNPVLSLADAVTLAASTGLRKYFIRKTSGGPLTLVSGHDDWAFEAVGEGVVVALAGQDVDGTVFQNCEISGTQSGRITALNCLLDGMGGLEGNFLNCRLQGGLSMPSAGGAVAFFDDCSSFVAGAATTPMLSVAGTLANLYQFRGYKGGIEIEDSDHAGTTGSIDQVAGQVILGASNIAGAVVVRGVMNITDTSGGGFTVTRTAALNLPDIENEILDADKTLHTTANTIGQQIQHTFQVVHADLDVGSGGVGTKDDPIGGGNPTGANAVVARMDAIGAKRAYLKYEGDYIRPTAGDWRYKEFYAGHGSTAGMDPNDLDFNGSEFRGLSITSTAGSGFGSYAAGFGAVHITDCILLGPLVLQAMTADSCQLATTVTAPLTLGDAGDYVFDGSMPFRPDSIAQPVIIDFTATAGQRVIFKHYPGRIIIRDMTLASHEIEIEGRGLDITFEASCTAGTARVAGWGEPIVDNSSTVVLDQTAYNVASPGTTVEAQANVAYDDGTSVLTVASWLDRDGMTVTGATSSTITLRDATNAVLAGFPVMDPTPFATGIFIFSVGSVTLADNTVFNLEVSVTDPTGTYTTNQSISTVA